MKNNSIFIARQRLITHGGYNIYLFGSKINSFNLRGFNIQYGMYMLIFIIKIKINNLQFLW
jgi:hypothetical protein